MQAVSLQVFVKRSMLLAFTSIESEYSKAEMGGWWVSITLKKIRSSFLAIEPKIC